jgi:prophage regulatory protein
MTNDTAALTATLRGFMRKPAIERVTGLSGAQVDLLEEKGEFPRRVPLGMRSVGWVEEEVAAWIRERIALRDDAARAAQLKADRAPPAVRHRLRQQQERDRIRAEEAAILAELQAAELTERERAGTVWNEAPT